MSKDIIVIRPAKIYCDLSPEDRDGIFYRFKEHFEDLYIVVVLFSENETNKTTFEIIKNE
jgi:hypothetical protein